MHRKDPDTDAAFLQFPKEAYSAEEDPELFPKASREKAISCVSMTTAAASSRNICRASLNRDFLPKSTTKPARSAVDWD